MEEAPMPVSQSYYNWCVYALCNDFPRVSKAYVRQVLGLHMKKLGPSYMALRREYLDALRENKNKNGRGIRWPFSMFGCTSGALTLKLRKSPRSELAPPRKICVSFDLEFKTVKIRIARENSFECGCCFSECSFDELVQCMDGHLFCFECLKRYVEEATFGAGQGSANLPCIETAGCSAFFPASEVARALPATVVSKYETRIAEELVARAGLQRLTYCPFCNIPYELDSELRELHCLNEACGKSSCLECNEPYHLPLKCEEVEKKSETLARRRIEEQMTKAVVRECPSCKAEFVKKYGCDMVTCKCGKIMCYVCRKPIRMFARHIPVRCCS